MGPYKIVMKKIGVHRNRVNGAGSCGTVMDQLFSQLPALVVTSWEDREGPPLLTAEEIDVAVERVRAKAKKMPGPDGIPNSVWTIVHRANPGILDAVFNKALKSGVFPT